MSSKIEVQWLIVEYFNNFVGQEISSNGSGLVEVIVKWSEG